MTPARVLFVIDSSAIGGAEQMICSLIEALPRGRAACYVACPPAGPMVRRYADAGAVVLPFRGPGAWRPSVIWQLARLIRRHRIQVVHTCLYTSDVGGALAARLAGNARVVAHVVGCNFLVVGAESGPRRWRRQLLSRVHRWVYRLADQVVAVSDHVRADLAERPGLRVPARRVAVIPHGCEDPPALSAERLEQVRQRYGLSSGEPLVAVAANLIPLKGHRYLLEALGRLAAQGLRVRCALIGDGPQREPLLRQAQALGIEDRVVVTGWIDNEVKWSLLHLSRCVALPSLSEGLPVSVLEAMAMGKPVVASRAGGIPEAVEHGRTGWLVRPADAAELAEALRRVLSDEEAAARMGAAGRQRRADLFSMAAMAARVQAVYDGARSEAEPCGSVAACCGK